MDIDIDIDRYRYIHEYWLCEVTGTNGDVRMRSVNSVYIVDSSPLTGEKHPHYVVFHWMYITLCMSNCMYNIGMVVKYTMHPLLTWKHAASH